MVRGAIAKCLKDLDSYPPENVCDISLESLVTTPIYEKTSPPSAQVAAMSDKDMQQ